MRVCVCEKRERERVNGCVKVKNSEEKREDERNREKGTRKRVGERGRVREE